jgi:hypothetical protein
VAVSFISFNHSPFIFSKHGISIAISAAKHVYAPKAYYSGAGLYLGVSKQEGEDERL